MFSDYKNTVTGKALIGISPHGSGLLFSDIYPGSISAITEQTCVLEWIQPEHELMADRGFSVQDYCSVKGVYLNRPAQKDSDQFSQSDVASNFDIASARIHVERFIGRARDWSILNAVWPLQRMDLLSSTWQEICHIVNLTMSPCDTLYDEKYYLQVLFFVYNVSVYLCNYEVFSAIQNQEFVQTRFFLNQKIIYFLCVFIQVLVRYKEGYQQLFLLLATVDCSFV